MNKVTAIGVAVTLGLVGCGGGSGGGLPAGNGNATVQNLIGPAAAPVVEIQNFVVVSGSDSTPSDTSLEVNSGINAGAFYVDWTVNASDPTFGTDEYIATMYLSSTEGLDKQYALRLGSMLCGTVAGTFCGETGALSCSFSTRDVIECLAAGKPQILSDTSRYIKAIPTSQFLIFEACNATGVSKVCETSFVPVTLQ